MTKTRTLSIDEIRRLVSGANDPCLRRYFAIYLMSAKRSDAVLQLPWQA